VNTAAIRRFVEVFGGDALNDLEPEQVTAAWRRQHVLVSTRVVPDDA
jgi:hypothetical protein